jgi:hypothetical protein
LNINRFENIIIHSFWSGPIENFNKYLENNSEIDSLISGQIKLNVNSGKDICFRAHAFIADAPALTLAANSKGFKGSNF